MHRLASSKAMAGEHLSGAFDRGSTRKRSTAESNSAACTDTAFEANLLHTHIGIMAHMTRTLHTCMHDAALGQAACIPGLDDDELRHDVLAVPGKPFCRCQSARPHWAVRCCTAAAALLSITSCLGSKERAVAQPGMIFGNLVRGRRVKASVVSRSDNMRHVSTSRFTHVYTLRHRGPHVSPVAWTRPGSGK